MYRFAQLQALLLVATTSLGVVSCDGNDCQSGEARCADNDLIKSAVDRVDLERSSSDSLARRGRVQPLLLAKPTTEDDFANALAAKLRLGKYLPTAQA